MSTPPRQPTEEELRAAYEAELKRLRVEDVLVQTVVSLVNLGGRKAGLASGTEDERDPQQLQLAIDGANAILPLVEPMLGADAQQVRTAISQLQLAFARMAGPGAGERPADEGGDQPGGQPQGGEGQPGGQGGQGPSGPGPAQSSGRLWVPGQ